MTPSTTVDEPTDLEMDHIESDLGDDGPLELGEPELDSTPEAATWDTPDETDDVDTGSEKGVCPYRRPDGTAPDFDGDGIDDCADNCRRTPNRGQADTDEDGLGNACDMNAIDLSLGHREEKFTMCILTEDDQALFCIWSFGGLLVPEDGDRWELSRTYRDYFFLSGNTGQVAVWAGNTFGAELFACSLRAQDGSRRAGTWDCLDDRLDDLPDPPYLAGAHGPHFCTLREDGRARCSPQEASGTGVYDYLSESAFDFIATGSYVGPVGDSVLNQRHVVCGTLRGDGRVACRRIWYWETCILHSICDRYPEHPDCDCVNSDWRPSDEPYTVGSGLAPDNRFDMISVTALWGCGIEQETQQLICWGEPAVPALLDHPEGRYLQVSVNDAYACAITVDNALDCWDADGTERMPHRMTEIRAQWSRPCGIDMDHNVRCY